MIPCLKSSLPRTEKDTLARHLQEETNNNNSGEADGANQADVVVALTVQGIAQKVAERLANRYSQPRIADKIKFLEFLKETDPQKVKSPQGWLRRAIEEDYAAPDGYKAAADREAEAAEKNAGRQNAPNANRQPMTSWLNSSSSTAPPSMRWMFGARLWTNSRQHKHP